MTAMAKMPTMAKIPTKTTMTSVFENSNNNIDFKSPAVKTIVSKDDNDNNVQNHNTN